VHHEGRYQRLAHGASLVGKEGQMKIKHLLALFLQNHPHFRCSFSSNLTALSLWFTGVVSIMNQFVNEFLRGQGAGKKIGLMLQRFGLRSAREDVRDRSDPSIDYVEKPLRALLSTRFPRRNQNILGIVVSPDFHRLALAYPDVGSLHHSRRSRLGLWQGARFGSRATAPAASS
jgi:hypothetical protein